MKKYWKKILLLLALCLIPLWALGDPPVYSAKDIHGQVVDAESGQPLEGVVVVAKWELYWIGVGQGGHGGSMNTIEVVTDKEGKYFIPGWGPRPRPPLAYLDYNDPWLRYFKSNYYPQNLTNEFTGSENRNKSMVRMSEWDGKVIKLKRFDGDWVDYGFNKLGVLWRGRNLDCVRECPRLLLGLDAESKRIKALAPKKSFISPILDIENFPADDREFFRKFKNDLK